MSSLYSSKIQPLNRLIQIVPVHIAKSNAGLPAIAQTPQEMPVFPKGSDRQSCWIISTFPTVFLIVFGSKCNSYHGSGNIYFIGKIGLHKTQN